MSSAVQDAWREARARWPDFELAESRFASFLAERPGWLPSHAGDLFLCCAALDGVPVALRALDALLVEVPSSLARLKLSPAEGEELTQRIRELLLVGPPRKLLEYAGRGPLGGWLRVLAVRLATRDRTRGKSFEAIEQSTLQTLAMHDPEHQVARAKWQQLFDESLRAAFQSLQEEERALFRLQFRQGLTLDQLATVLQVHRATVARRTGEAREKLWANLTAQIRTRLGAAEGDEAEALLRGYRSRLEISLSALLAESP